MENHLLIGLGGTGGRVLAAFRKLMYERFNGEVKPKDLWLDYLYVDSSEQDLKMKDPAQWSVMGNNIALDADSIVKIPAANLADYVNNRSRFPYLAPWLGNLMIGAILSMILKSVKVQLDRSVALDVCSLPTVLPSSTVWLALRRVILATIQMDVRLHIML